MDGAARERPQCRRSHGGAGRRQRDRRRQGTARRSARRRGARDGRRDRPARRQRRALDPRRRRAPRLWRRCRGGRRSAPPLHRRRPRGARFAPRAGGGQNRALCGRRYPVVRDVGAGGAGAAPPDRSGRGRLCRLAGVPGAGAGEGFQRGGRRGLPRAPRRHLRQVGPGVVPPRRPGDHPSLGGPCPRRRSAAGLGGEIVAR